MTATSATPADVLDGRYELRSMIGQGTFGRVYRGYDRRLRRSVAVKVIKPWWTEDPEWTERFEREAQLMARVTHPGIVQIYDVGSDRGVFYYVAELVEGESLAASLRRGPLAPSQARDVAEQLCRALAQAHAQRVVHRDVKPGNVLIDRSARVKVGDFGIARLAEAESDAAGGTVLGTPRYMAPEQAHGHSPTPATDVYGAGIVLYEMLAGRPPFSDGSAVELALRHLSEPPPPLPAGTPPSLVEIVMRALAKHPSERYPSAREMADALASADVSGADTAATAPPPVARRKLERTRVRARLSPRHNVNPSENRLYRLLLAGVLVLLAAMIGVVVLTANTMVRVPSVRGLSRAGVAARARARDLRASFTERYDQAPVGRAISQRPAPGARVGEGSTLRVVLSAGPPPVRVPQLVGDRATDARAILAGLGLVGTVTQVPAPGVTPGLVVAQSAPSASERPRHSTINLSVAEVPRWRPLTTFSGDGTGRSVPFRIRGDRWRVVYSAGWDGTCGFLGLFCSGPSAQVTDITSGATPGQFGLNQGSGQTQVFNSGPGVYEINVTPGSDSAHWSIQVEDDY